MSLPWHDILTYRPQGRGRRLAGPIPLLAAGDRPPTDRRAIAGPQTGPGVSDAASGEVFPFLRGVGGYPRYWPRESYTA
jgi:hypothetical protein